jgi:murein DD-endopeptidase MepM/ murein hydrolase activator NlpD
VRQVVRRLRHPRAYLRSRPRALQRRVSTFFGEPSELERREVALSTRIRALDAGSQPGAAPAPRLAVAPVVGKITSGFGERFGRMHFGSDFAVPEGTPIRVASDGAVALIEMMPDYGMTTVVCHGDGVTSLYAHQQRVDVVVGARVRAGDVIGSVGSTGRTTGPHLHFEVRVDGSPCDPLPVLPASAAVEHPGAGAR